MATERDLELLDDYIGNRLDATQREAFEAMAQGDPELQRELRLQQGIVDSLRKARTAELKHMLNSIPPSAISSSSSIVSKWAGVAIAVMVALGLYFVLTPEEQPAQTPIVADSAAEQRNAPAEAQTHDDAAPAEKSQETVPAPAVKEQPAGDKQQPKSSAAPADVPDQAKRPQLEVFDPTEEVTSDTGIPANQAPNSATRRKGSSDITSEVISDNKEYKFHYQFKSDRLILYGDFDKSLYEILEFISENKRTIFLSYRDTYYLLNADNDKIKPLNPVKDPALIQKLRDYQQAL